MANHNRGPRSRSRKRRQGSAAPRGESAGADQLTRGGAAPSGTDEQAAERKRAAKAGRSTARARQGSAQRSEPRRGFRDPLSYGERPQAPWHPVPVSELLILIGAIATVIGLKKGASSGGAPLFVGLAAVVIGTVEVTLREHLSGYRAHTLILAVLPVIVFHTAVVLIFHTPQSVNIGLVVVDVGLVLVLFKLLRARFRDARRERVFAGRR